MAEAEDVITDAARHLTEFSQTLWRKHRPRNEISFVMLADLARDIELLITAVFGSPYRIRASQAPAPPTLLARLFRPQPHTGQRHSLPATDGVCIWLPVHAGTSDMALGRQRYRVAALQQAVRSQRGSVLLLPQADQGTADFYLLLESFAADRDLVRLLPGMAPQIAAARLAALKERPAQSSLSVAPRQVEQLVQAMLRAEINPVKTVWPVCETPGESLHEALRLNGQLLEIHGVLGEHRGRYVPLFKDWWTGELRPPEPPPRPLT